MALARVATFASVGAATLGAALWLRSLGIFSAAAALLAVRASAFLAAPSPAAFGFDLEPLTVLLAVPAAALPQLAWDPLAPALVSAVAATFCAWWLVGALGAAGLGLGPALLLAVAAVAHPVFLYAAASGSGGVIATALLVASLRLFRSWQRSGETRPLLVSAFALALAGLARYQFFVVGFAIAALVWLGPSVLPGRADRGQDEVEHPLPREGSPRARVGMDERPAFAIAYAAAVGGVLGLWLVGAGLFTGDPLSFVAASAAALGAPPTPGAPLHVLVVMLPALVLAAVAAFRRRALAPALGVGVVCAAALAASAVSGSRISLDAVVPLVPLTALLIGELLPSPSAARAAIASLAAAALVGTGAAALALSDDWGEGHAALARALSGGSVVMWSGEREAAAFVRASGASVSLDERVNSAVALLLGGVARPLGPSSGALPETALVLVRTPTGRGQSDRIAARWPTLYAGGAPWATAAGKWPVSGEAAEYRLYSVRAVSGR